MTSHRLCCIGQLLDKNSQTTKNIFPFVHKFRFRGNDAGQEGRRFEQGTETEETTEPQFR